MRLHWKLTDNTTCFVQPWNLPRPYVEAVQGLPLNWNELDWHRVIQSPCIWGDDLLITVDSVKQMGYVIHDVVCTIHPWIYSLEYFVISKSENPLEDED